ncbi:MAG: RagB/SusD family nutrient uptake outer membrane protein [Butyricimonas faecihominis]
MPMIKLSEMYLIVAECSFDLDSEMSLEYLNVLRDHRIRNHVHTIPVKESIQDEMRREYLGEGQMWYVMKRNNLKIETGLLPGILNFGCGVRVPDARCGNRGWT